MFLFACESLEGVSETMISSFLLRVSIQIMQKKSLGNAFQFLVTVKDDMFLAKGDG